jgi:hypothetical protein
LSFSATFSVKNVWKTNNIFHHKLCWKTQISQPVTRDWLAALQPPSPYVHCKSPRGQIGNKISFGWIEPSWVQYTHWQWRSKPEMYYKSTTQVDCPSSQLYFYSSFELTILIRGQTGFRLYIFLFSLSKINPPSWRVLKHWIKDSSENCAQ